MRKRGPTETVSEEERSNPKDGPVDLMSDTDTKIMVTKEQWQLKHEKQSEEDIVVTVPSREATDAKMNALVGASQVSGSDVGDSAEDKSIPEATQKDDLKSSTSEESSQIALVSDDASDSKDFYRHSLSSDEAEVVQSIDESFNPLVMVLWRHHSGHQVDPTLLNADINQEKSSSRRVRHGEDGELSSSSNDDLSIIDVQRWRKVSIEGSASYQQQISDEETKPETHKMQDSERPDSDDFSYDTNSSVTTSRRSSSRPDPSTTNLTGRHGEGNSKETRQPHGAPRSRHSKVDNRLKGRDSLPCHTNQASKADVTPAIFGTTEPIQWPTQILCVHQWSACWTGGHRP